MLTASEVAALLNVAPAWVYRHKDALGGFQPFHGCTVRFPENRIEAIKEGKVSALYDAQREMAGKTDDTRAGQNKDLRHEAASKAMGGRTNHRRLEASRERDPSGLLA